MASRSGSPSPSVSPALDNLENAAKENLFLKLKNIDIGGPKKASTAGKQREVTPRPFDPHLSMLEACKKAVEEKEKWNKFTSKTINKK